LRRQRQPKKAGKPNVKPGTDPKLNTIKTNAPNKMSLGIASGSAEFTTLSSKRLMIRFDG
jgi:hypothetical protein